MAKRRVGAEGGPSGVRRRPGRRRALARLFALGLATLGVPALGVPALLARPAAAAAAAPPPAVRPSPAPAPGDPLAPATTGGLETVDRALARLATHRRLLVIGAHPDDEDNALLAWVARGLGGEAAYLSLSRGEGGQNLIGDELGEALGVLRTGELMAARAVEGTRQLFAHAYDFGYTRSLEETFERWPRSELVEATVRAVRRFRPQVIVAIFPADERAGHGQHQASAVVARDAFEAAGDPEAYPEVGPAPWRPSALFRRAWRVEDATHTFPLDAIDPFAGRSLAQVAAEARSLHRSQDMGTLQRIGPTRGGAVRLVPAPETEGGDLFDGIATDLAAIAAPLEEPVRSRVARGLAGVERAARQARRELVPGDSGAAGALAAIVGQLQALLDGPLAAAGECGSERSPAAVAAARDLVEEKLRVAATGLASAAGLVVDATADREAYTPGRRLELTVTVWNTGDRPVAARLGVQSGEPPGSSARWIGDSYELGELTLLPGELAVETARIDLRTGMPPTRPLQLAAVRVDDLYRTDELPADLRGEPVASPPLVASIELEIHGVRVDLRREVVFRTVDQAVGEVRRPLRAVPEVEIALSPGRLIWPLDGADTRRLEVEVRSNLETPTAGTVELALPEGWPPVAPRSFELRGGGQLRLGFELVRPAPAVAGTATVEAAARTDGENFRLALPLVDYPHIRPMPVPVPARVDVMSLEIAVPPLGAVAYLRGASDRSPELLAEVGLPIELVTAADLAAEDLDRFDAVVIGPRAYETEAGLAAVNPALLDFARRGGTVVVQYQQYAFARGGYAPWPLDIARPHGRVTSERSPVVALLPDHPALVGPNRIGPDAWRGWVQERGLYFASTWDPRYEAPLELADPGQQPERGALLVARLGEGWWVYTGLAFFRQLPAGVPGAYELLVNLLSLGGAA